MSYFEGFVCAVPAARKDEYLEHAREASAIFADIGIDRMVENWGDDVPRGKLTDFYRAVQATDDEAVVFSWFEYPDKAARNAANEKMMADPRMEAMAKDMPFDGQRMIMGGFESLLDERGAGRPGYTDGFIVPVANSKREAYLAMARKGASKFKEHGAVRVVEAWGDDVPDGKVTDYRKATQAQDGETVVYSFIEWPDKATRDAAWAKLMEDPEMQPDGEMPFDGKRMFWGGFQPIFDSKAAERADA